MSPGSYKPRTYYLVVCGSRIKNKFIVNARKWVIKTVTARIQELLLTYDEVVLVNGKCSDSPDVWARATSITLGCDYLDYPARWKDPGMWKTAGFLRNEEMMCAVSVFLQTNPDATAGVMAFWDKESHGTEHAIGMAEKYGLNVTITDMSMYRE